MGVRILYWIRTIYVTRTPALGRLGEKMKKKVILLLILLSSTLLFAQDYVHFDKVDTKYWPYVNDDNVRVRTYPSIEHSKIITKYSTGKKVNVLEKTVNEKNELWYQIKVDDDQWGWMFGEYISFSEEYPASQVYEREFSKYGTFIEAFYYELFDIYLYGDPYTYENQNCLKKLLAGKSPASYSSYSSIANDDGKLYSTPTTIYEIDGCLIEVTGTYPGCWWYSSTFTKNVPNSFGVKMGMTLEELKEIFGPETKQYNGPKAIGETVNFIFDKNEKLIGIYIYNESGS